MEHLKKLEKNNIITSPVSNQAITDTKSVNTWITRCIDLEHNLSKGIFPRPYLFRKMRFMDKSYNVIKYSHQILDLSYSPKYLGECKYRG